MGPTWERDMKQKLLQGGQFGQIITRLESSIMLLKTGCTTYITFDSSIGMFDFLHRAIFEIN